MDLPPQRAQTLKAENMMRVHVFGECHNTKSAFCVGLSTRTRGARLDVKPCDVAVEGEEKETRLTDGSW